MLDQRTAYERRVWRLAYMLTEGDERAAVGLVFDIVDRQPRLASLDAVHLDRLIVQASREWLAKRGAGVAGSPPQLSENQRRVFTAAAAMPAQLREAWVLTRVDGLGELHVSRAMDCSKTATARHLAAADEHMAQATGLGVAEAAGTLRGIADATDVGPSIERYRREKNKQRRVRLLAVAALILGALVLAVRYAPWR